MSTPPVDFAHTAFAVEARMVKAAELADVLHTAGIPAMAAATLPVGSRRRVERGAGVRPCSDLTWRVAIATLAQREAEQ